MKQCKENIMSTYFSMTMHIWELPGNYPVFIMVMVIYHYAERIWRILVTPDFFITYTIMRKKYSGEPVNIYIQ